MKRKLLLFLVAAITFFGFSQPVSAYYGGGDDESAIEKFEESVFGSDEYNQESHAYSNTEGIFASINNLIGGCQTEDCQNVLLSDSGGAIGSTTNLIGQIFSSPPASGQTYLADLGERLNITQTAYAQSTTGFEGLKPILEIWRLFRNVAYAFFVLVFCIIGLAIMFRAKINPQTVVTIQSAIPKIVISLVLVTFSYAIAGLMIDLMYVVTGIGVAIVGGGNFEGIVASLSEEGLIDNITNTNSLTFSTYFWARGLKSTYEVGNIFNPIANIINLVGEIPDWFATALKASTYFITGGLGLVVSLILNIILLFAFFRIFINLIGCYVQIILSIIIAPLQLMLGAIPGFNTFGKWIKNLLVNLLPFSVIIILMALSGNIISLIEVEDSGMWIAPIIRPAIGNGTLVGSTIGAIFSFGILLLLPRVPEMIKSAFEKQPFDYGTAIGEGFSRGLKPFTKPAEYAKNVGGKVIEDVGVKSVEGWISNRKPKVTETEVDNNQRSDLESFLNKNKK